MIMKPVWVTVVARPAKHRLAQVFDGSTKCLRIAAYDAASTGPDNPGTVRPPGPSAKITQGARPLQ
jgi:hypothetical protein